MQERSLAERPLYLDCSSASVLCEGTNQERSGRLQTVYTVHSTVGAIEYQNTSSMYTIASMYSYAHLQSCVCTIEINSKHIILEVTINLKQM